jgi:hypothetical protein
MKKPIDSETTTGPAQIVVKIGNEEYSLFQTARENYKNLNISSVAKFTNYLGKREMLDLQMLWKSYRR